MAEESSRSWSSATTWIVNHGSLNNSVSFETPISEIDEDCLDIEDSRSPKDQVLLMNPPSPDSGPCEITISFGQRHEIRQVYVRSTARVYEIYYAPDLQSSNEYLCTVRCGIVAKEDASGTEEAISTHLERSIEPVELPDVQVKNDNNNGTDEDGWVEVKVPDSPLLDNRTNSLVQKIGRNTERSFQDFYEATAEITDASPCISLTLRLLSLQTKECVHLEEIYIFAEPVESTDLDHQVHPVENSAGSSFMAMLVPTLLQLSKTGIKQDRHVSDIRERLKYQDGESKETESIDPKTGRTMQQEAQSSMVDGGEPNMEEVAKDSAELTRLESGKQVPGTGQGPDSVTKENDVSYGRVERVLDQLVCRVGRIEVFCLRFEENMLKPLSSIETRLQQLERQLEVLTMRSQSSELFPCTRITTPEFACNESKSNALYTDGNDGRCCGGLEYASTDIPSTRITAPEFSCNESESNSIYNDGNDDHCKDSPFQLYPSLVVTAPEFSNDDDDDGCGGGGGDDDDDDDDDDDKNCNDISASANEGYHTDKPSLSIDDALASALAGFLSSNSVSTQTLIFKAPDFPNEEHGSNDRLTSPSVRISCERAAFSDFCFGENNGTESMKDSDSTLCSSEMQVMELPNDGPIELAVEAVSGRGQLQEDEIKGSCKDTIANQTVTQNRHDREWAADDTSSTEDTTSRLATLDQLHKEWTEDSSPDLTLNGRVIHEPCTDTVNRTFIESQHFVEQNYGNSPDGSPKEVITSTDFTSNTTKLQYAGDATPKEVVTCTDFTTTTTEVQHAGSNKNGSENVFKQTFSSVVDFKLPVLDVKFVPQENWNVKSSLEALLGDMLETKVQDSCFSDNDDGVSYGEQSQLFFIEDKELKVPLDDQLLVEVDDLTVKTVPPPSNMLGEQIQDPSTCEEPFSSLI